MSCKLPGFIAVIGITLILISQAQSQIPPDVKLQVDKLIGEFIEFHNVPGMALSIVQNNTIRYTTGYGFKDIEDGIATDDATVFGIGSISKSFTATVVVKTLNKMFPELGEKALDIPIRTLAPSYNFTLGDRYRSESATFRDLLSHRACLEPETLGIFAGPFKNTAEFVYRQRYAPEKCQFRTEFVYNNGILAVASEIIAHIASSTFEEMLQELLTEVGMNDSTWVKDSDDHNTMPGRSAPYYKEDGQLKKMNPELLKPVIVATGSGGILSSARDMAKYLEFHLNYGKVGEVQVVPEEVMKWIYRGSMLQESGLLKSEETDLISKNYAYALCLSLAIYDGWQIVQHGGYLPPYESLFTLAPELKLGIFTAASGPGSFTLTTFQQQELHIRIFEMLRGADSTRLGEIRKLIQKKAAASKIEKKLKPSNVTFSKHNLKLEPSQIVGNFGSGMSGELEITLRENDESTSLPYLNYGRLAQAWLKQISDLSFEIEWDSDIYQLFLADGSPTKPDPFVLQFVDIDSFVFTQSGTVIGNTFYRNVTLSNLPIVPWNPDSCGPVKILSD